MRKMLRSVLAIGMALCLLLGSVPSLAASEESSIQAEAAQTAEAAIEQDEAENGGAPAATMAPPPAQTPDPAPTQSATQAPDPAPAQQDDVSGETEAPRQADSADAVQAPTEEPAGVFEAGYVRLASGTVFYFDDGSEKNLKKEAIAYAFEYSEREARIRVAFHDGERAQKAWVEAKRARMLSAEQVEAYLKQESEEDLKWNDCILRPLAFEEDEASELKQTEVGNEILNTALPEATSGVEATPSAEATATLAPGEGGALEAGSTPGTDGAANGDELPDEEDALTPDDVPGPSESPAASASPEPDASVGASASETPAAQETPAPTMEAVLDATRAPVETQPPVDMPLDAPELYIDFIHEQVVVRGTEVEGEMHFYRPDETEAFYVLNLAEAGCVDLQTLGGVPQAASATVLVEHVLGEDRSARVTLEIPARPAFVPEENTLVDAGYTTATISGGGSCAYALSLMDGTAPEVFGENGLFQGLKGGTQYAVWASNPASEGTFASEWAMLEGIVCETMPRMQISASFSAETVTGAVNASWFPGFAPLDAMTSVHFLDADSCLDGEIAGNYTFAWRDASGEALDAPPANAGVYTLEVTLTGEAQRYELMNGGALVYTIAPLTLKDAEISVLADGNCVYNGLSQFPENMRVVSDGCELPADSYTLARIDGANSTDAGEALGMIVGDGRNVTGERAFAYRIEPKPVTVVPESISDFAYTGDAYVPLMKTGWALHACVDGDDVSVDLSNVTACVDSAAAGEGKRVVFSGIALRGADAGNYVIETVEERSINILRAAAPEIVWPSVGEIAYGQRLADAVLTGGSVELGSFAWTDGSAMPGAGSQSFEMVFTPADADNYAWSAESLRCMLPLTVQPRKASIYAGSFSKTVGESDPSLTASTEGVLEGDRLSYSLSRSSGEAPGKYTVSVKLGENPNYSISTKNGKLTIERKSLNASSVTVASIPRQVYTGLEIEPKPVVRDGHTVLREGTDYSSTYNGNRREGVATLTLTGMGNYTGSQTVSFTIYKLSSTGGISNNYGVEGEESNLHSAEDAEESEALGWESGYTFLYDEEKLNNALYDEYLGTGEGLGQLDIVQDGSDMPVEYEFLIIDSADEEPVEEETADDVLLVCAGPDADGEVDSRTFALTGAQLARLYLEHGVGTLLFRNCDTTAMLDVYEMLTGDIAKLAGRMLEGGVQSGASASELFIDDLPEYNLSAEELFDLSFELRVEAEELESGEAGYGLSVWLCCDDVELEISNMLAMLSVCANVDGLFEEGEEEAFVERAANARLNEAGVAEALEGDLMLLPEEFSEDEADEAECYVVTPPEDGGASVVQYDPAAPLSLYRCQMLVSPWAGPGVYLLLDQETEE